MPHSDKVPPICRVLKELVEEAGLTQEAFGALVSEKQQTVSAWLKRRVPTLDDLAKIEEALGRPRGYLVRAAGYVTDPATARAAIEGDHGLSENWRRIVLTTYDTGVEATARERSSSPTTSSTRAS